MNELSPLLVSRAIIVDGEKILALQRSSDDSHNACQWEFPGGKVDAGEELLAGLNREVGEETGLSIQATSQLAYVESEIVVGGKYDGRLYVALFFSARRLSGEITLSNEHSAYVWDEPEKLLNLNLAVESRHALESFFK